MCPSEEREIPKWKVFWMMGEVAGGEGTVVLYWDVTKRYGRRGDVREVEEEEEVMF